MRALPYLLLVGAAGLAAAQEPAVIDKPEENALEDFNIEAFLGTVETEAESAAVRLAIDLTSQLNGEFFDPRGKVTWKVAPDIKILTGDDDGFNGFNAKLTALGAILDPSVLDAEPGASFLFAHTFPISGGVESDADFQTVNGLLEVGYVPWFNAEKLKTSVGKGSWLIAPGAFLQIGHKFASDEGTPATPKTPDNDESEEQEDDILARVKLGLKVKSPIYSIAEMGTFDLRAQGIVDAYGWYDIENSEVYHRVVGTLRFNLTEDKSFDLNYESGSGAPNFNQGEQFSAGLTVNF
jgi:hypothetical protein